MPRLVTEQRTRVAVIAVFLVTLASLAVLQFRWTGQLSQAQRATIETALANSVHQFEQEFNRELAHLLNVFRPDPAAAANGEWQRYLERYEEWYQSSAHAPLISRVLLYLTPPNESGSLYELQLDEWQLASATWHSNQEPIERHIAGWAERSERGRPRDARMFAWTFFSKEKAFVLPLNFFDRRQRDSPAAEAIATAGFIVIELDAEFLAERMMPQMVARYFSGPDGEPLYQVAVIEQGAAGFLYRSDQSIDDAWLANPDLRAPLLAMRRDGQRPGDQNFAPGAGPVRTDFRGRGGRGRNGFPSFAGGPPFGDDPRPRGEPGRPGDNPRRRAGPSAGSGGGGRPPIFFGRSVVFLADGEENGQWLVAAKHIAGSLDAAVQLQRRRDLGVGFGVLLLLGGAMAMVLISSQRAKRLADMQMEFVAGVSHELRTPLAVICSAGDNLADGVVSSGQQVSEYGRLIRDQGRRLADMVEQTLRFATLQSGKSTYKLESVDVAQVIVETLEEAGPAIEKAGFELQQSVEPDLPPVRADRTALRQSLENLVNNAVKYGADGRWLKIEAAGVRVNGSREVQIRVHDRGLGIAPHEAKSIFEAFYRGAAATEAQIQGSGLGLKLARDMALGMGGDLTVESEPGQGSVFTIHLPLAEV